MRRRWHFGGCHRPFIGVERERLVCGVVYRVSLWPNRFGFHIAWWMEKEAAS